MCKTIEAYKKLKSQLTPNVGCEESTIEVGWNDGIKEEMERLLEDVPEHIKDMIRKNIL